MLCERRRAGAAELVVECRTKVQAHAGARVPGAGRVFGLGGSSARRPQHVRGGLPRCLWRVRCCSLDLEGAAEYNAASGASWRCCTLDRDSCADGACLPGLPGFGATQTRQPACRTPRTRQPASQTHPPAAQASRTPRTRHGPAALAMAPRPPSFSTSRGSGRGGRRPQHGRGGRQRRPRRVRCCCSSRAGERERGRQRRRWQR